MIQIHTAQQKEHNRESTTQHSRIGQTYRVGGVVGAVDDSEEVCQGDPRALVHLHRDSRVGVLAYLLQLLLDAVLGLLLDA
mgnify:CR=1 FL=1